MDSRHHATFAPDTPDTSTCEYVRTFENPVSQHTLIHLILYILTHRTVINVSGGWAVASAAFA